MVPGVRRAGAVGPEKGRKRPVGTNGGNAGGLHGPNTTAFNLIKAGRPTASNLITGKHTVRFADRMLGCCGLHPYEPQSGSYAGLFDLRGASLGRAQRVV